MPYFSIIIPTFNSASVIRFCLDSIFSSTNRSFEVIVVDGGSTDDTLSIIKNYKIRLVEQKDTKGRAEARNLGIEAAKGKVLVFTDSDNVLAKDSFEKIKGYFESNPKTDAIVGMLSIKHPNKDFFSQYKNLYMHHKFVNLPEDINFLQGDLYAVRKNSVEQVKSDLIADDTLRGVIMRVKSKKINLLKNLEVIHLKKYNLGTIIKNDFMIPFNWSVIFLQQKAWKMLKSNGGGFAHASREQLISLLIAPMIIVFLFASKETSFTLIVLWLVLNGNFHWFLYKERGLWFATRSVVFTYIDNLVMMCGIISGFAFYILNPKSFC